jgi:O-succinylbenzoic acid--CoA ligase
VPVAVVETTENVTDDALIAWARSKLAGFKVPRAWVRAESIPRNATGKVDRTALAALVA